MDLFLGSPFCSVDLFVYMPVPHWQVLTSGSISCPTLFFFIRLIWIFNVLCITIHILELVCQFLWKSQLTSWLGFHWIIDLSGESWHLNSIKSSNPFTWCEFPFIYVFFNFYAFFFLRDSAFFDCFQCRGLSHILWNVSRHVWCYFNAIVNDLSF